MDSEPTSMAFNASRILGRSCESLLGICQGLLADNELNEREAGFLALWLRDNRAIASVWPGSAIADRVNLVLSDGVVTKAELEDLKAVLASLIGGTLAETGSSGGLSCALPTNAFAKIEFTDRSFCFTGKFLFGTRAKCGAAIRGRGGIHFDAVVQDLHYLVIGTLVSPDWRYSSLGRKIEAAVELQRKGKDLQIVAEEPWVRALGHSPPLGGVGRL